MSVVIMDFIASVPGRWTIGLCLAVCVFVAVRVYYFGLPEGGRRMSIYGLSYDFVLTKAIAAKREGWRVERPIYVSGFQFAIDMIHEDDPVERARMRAEADLYFEKRLMGVR